VQAPTGSNRQGWRWLVVTDAGKRAALADLYRRSFGPYISRSLAAGGDTPPAGARSLGERPPLASARSGRRSRVADSAIYLADHLHEVPVHVIPCIEDYTKGQAHAGVFASIYPAVWSLQLALRSRGLGSVLTTLHLVYEAEAAELLGIPDGVLQVGLVPVAYFTGDDFKPARRRPVEELTSWDEWGGTRS
jgi:nitroreductase